MKAFSYQAVTDSGRKRKGTVVAESESQVSQILRGQGLYATRITAKAPSSRSGLFRKGRMNDDMRAVFTRQMAVLLGAELSADAALETVRSSGTSVAIETAAAVAKAGLMGGLPLSAALQKTNAGFPPYYLASVSAGEISGNLASVFENLADYLEQQNSDRALLSTALIYPAFVATVAVLVCAVLMVNVAPEIAGMFAVSGRELPELTQIVIGISDWLQLHWIALLIGVGSVITGLVLALRIPSFRDHWDGMLLRLPVLGRLLRLAAAAQYLRTLALVIGSRLTVIDAVSSASEVLNIRRFQQQAAAVHDAIGAGESLSDSLKYMPLIPPVCRQLIHAGEQSARLGKMTERSAVLLENWLNTERKKVVALY